MTLQIKLEENKPLGLLVKSEPLFLLEGDEEIQIEFLTEINKAFIVTAKNGDVVRQFVVKNRRFTISNDLKFEGEIEMVVSLYTHSTLAYKWACEPIAVVKPRKDVFELHPKISVLEDEIFRLKEEVSALIGKVENLQNQTTELWQIQES